MDPSDFDPIWRGSKEIEECLGSPKIKRTARGWTAVRTYDGVFTELQAKAPDIGSKMADMGELMVDEVNIEPTGGGAGLMTVTMLLDSQAGIGAPADPVFEIEWIEVQKDITRHWRYNVGGPDELDQDEFACLKKARNGDVNAINQIINNFFEDVSLQKIWAKILAGQEDYVEYIPVITETVTLMQPPQDQNVGAGFIDAPPGGAMAPAGWQWLRTAAPTTRQGNRWSVRRQWTGARFIDSEIYGAYIH